MIEESANVSNKQPIGSSGCPTQPSVLYGALIDVVEHVLALEQCPVHRDVHADVCILHFID